MIRRQIRALRRFDEAYGLARDAGLGRRESVRAASGRASRDAFLALGRVPARRGGVLVDVGANRGQFLAQALLRFAPRRVVCLEPLPVAREELVRRFGADPRVEVLPWAAGASPGVSRLHVPHHDPASSLLPMVDGDGPRFVHHDLSPAGTVDVQVRTLDALAEELHLDAVDLLKIDVQGFELQVLAGAERLLARVGTLLVEVSFYELYEGGVLFWELHRFLAGSGFLLHRLDHFQTGESGVVLQADAVYRRRGGSAGGAAVG